MRVAQGIVSTRICLRAWEVVMLRWLIGKRLNAAERTLGVSLEYARHILRVSLRAFFKFIKIMPLAEYRRALPAAPFYAARIVAIRHDDCGECVQIAVNQAKNAGVSAGLIQAVLAGRWGGLPDDLGAARRRVAAVVGADGG